MLHYLARYAHRVAISNHRLLNVTDDDVTFRWKDHARRSKSRAMTLSHEEFLPVSDLDMEFSGCTDDWVSGFRRMVRQCPCHFVSSWTRSSPSCDLVEKTRRVRSGVTERPSDRLYGAGATSTALPVSNE